MFRQLTTAAARRHYRTTTYSTSLASSQRHQLRQGVFQFHHRYQIQQQQQHRPFFWGNSNDNNNDDGGKGTKKGDDDRKNKKDEDVATAKTTVAAAAGATTGSDTEKSLKDDTNDDPTTTTTTASSMKNNNRRKNVMWGHSFVDGTGDDDSPSSGKSTGGGGGVGGGGGGLLLPSRQGFGDDSPRYPHLVGLPVVTRPLFPGVFTSVTLTDPVTIDAVEKAGYIGVFLRKSEAGVIIDTPEVITDPKQLHKVGTFAQVYKVNRGIGATSSNLHHSSLQQFTKSSSASSSSSSTGDDGGSESDNDSDTETDPESSSSVASLLIMSHRRLDLLSVDNVGPPIDVSVKHWDARTYNPDENSKTRDTIRALTNEILSTIREVATLNPLFREHLQLFPTRVDAGDPYRLADFVASVSAGAPEELQGVLEEGDAEKRLHKALTLLSKEKEIAKMQKEISAKVEEKMSEAQRKYFLTEQLKSIKKELGMERDDKEALVDKYRKTMASYGDVPAEVTEVVEEELEKLSSLEKNSSEFNVTRSYLDWLTSVPWGVTSEDSFDLRDAKMVLERDHYGMEDVKDIILQFIAIGKLRKSGAVQGKILCLCGPPGTGKTSIAGSIAEALHRKFYRFSVGGLSDVSEIKGHRRTYVGALPGKMIQCLKSSGTVNPLVLIDEIDKLGRDFRGDPASALLEVLDPSQNSSFRDHFLDVPVDLSKVLFMCTANDIGTIPGPLLDRMEVVHLSGYDIPEKMAIAEQYLIPKLMHENGLTVLLEEQEEEEKAEEKKVESSEDDTDHKQTTIMKKPVYVPAEGIPPELTITSPALEKILRWYCREAGVRNLSKHINKICRKLALQIVAEQDDAPLTEKTRRKTDTWIVDEDNLENYIGKPIFTSDRLYDTDPLPCGIVMGLAWTSLGGSALYIETQAVPRNIISANNETGPPPPPPAGSGTLKVTGQLGSVMSESTQIAHTVARARLSTIDPSNTFFSTHDIHMHVPEGATPKDGPSAGVTMVTSLLSLALGVPTRSDVAMTGEVSLTGKVLPVGGIKEKVMAARRAGIGCLVLPEGNRRDWEEVKDYLKDGLEVHFATDYNEVYEVALDYCKEKIGDNDDER
eukprot:CAMPEP_0172495928 /NCGR_PEP_ID=MMETSP1066-20121228/79732_1 /TAXON_ID=671091 /ORGANISM="Coscinodiscus wailesii, Strain CCMP2513" /LENGTH=1102 /DNA_ID=CAMNT_0013267945 /DNA_START=173 /DNA_END=3481 /DNA_ORIENTATION=+